MFFGMNSASLAIEYLPILTPLAGPEPASTNVLAFGLAPNTSSSVGVAPLPVGQLLMHLGFPESRQSCVALSEPLTVTPPAVGALASVSDRSSTMHFVPAS